MKTHPSHTAWVELKNQAASTVSLHAYLDAQENEPVEILINQLPEFTQQLIEHGHGYILNPGDVLLLPQKNSDECAWHSVFCGDDYMGMGLSFAIRDRP